MIIVKGNVIYTLTTLSCKATIPNFFHLLVYINNKFSILN